MTTVLLVLASILLVILLTSKFQFNAFFALVLVALGLGLLALPPDQTIPTLKSGFGNTLGAIGLIIIFGTTIGVILDRTGATRSMAHRLLRLTGPGKASRAVAVTGFLTGLPIFCDSGFIVLSGLNKSLARQSGTPLVRMAATLAISLYVLHCLIPPHPGITAATGILNGSISRLVLLGTAIALPATLAGYLWIRFLTRHAALTDPERLPETATAPEELPRALWSFLPVIAPLLLITLSSVGGLVAGFEASAAGKFVRFLGDPVIALLAGVFLALWLMRGKGLQAVHDVCAAAIEKAGPILAITAAGGAFGAVIKATGLGDQVSRFLGTTQLGLLVPFLLAAILKTAQGSSTVAAITAASITAPLLPGLGLTGEWSPTFALLAIGSGSMMVSHANDSYFWVVTRFQDLDPKDTLRVFSSATVAVSLTSFGLTWALSLLWPRF